MRNMSYAKIITRNYITYININIQKRAWGMELEVKGVGERNSHYFYSKSLCNGYLFTNRVHASWYWILLKNKNKLLYHMA
jgi:hypothetical protein